MTAVGQYKWTLYDPIELDTYIFDTNPNQMGPVYEPKSILPGARSVGDSSQRHSLTGTQRIMQGKRQPLSWSFGGTIRTRAQYLALRNWSHRKHRLHVTDHFNRTWLVLIEDIRYTEKLPNPHSIWRYTYVANCVLLGRVS